jgi:hypothetical protein
VDQAARRLARAWSFRPITTPAAPISSRIASEGSGTGVPPDEDEEDELGMPPDEEDEVLPPPEVDDEVLPPPEVDVELCPPEVDEVEL